MTNSYLIYLNSFKICQITRDDDHYFDFFIHYNISTVFFLQISAVKKRNIEPAVNIFKYLWDFKKSVPCFVCWAKIIMLHIILPYHTYYVFILVLLKIYNFDFHRANFFPLHNLVVSKQNMPKDTYLDIHLHY